MEDRRSRRHNSACAGLGLLWGANSTAGPPEKEGLRSAGGGQQLAGIGLKGLGISLTSVPRAKTAGLGPDGS